MSSVFRQLLLWGCALFIASSIQAQSGSLADSCTSSIDIIQLMNVFGTSVPDVEIAMHNHHQDIYDGESYLGQLTRVNGQPILSPELEWQIDSTYYAYRWYVNDSLVTTKGNPKVNDLDSLISGPAIPCDGIVRLRQEVHVGHVDATFSREVWAFIDFNAIPNCVCDTCPSPTEIFYPFYPEDYQPHDYIVSPSPLDWNQDNHFDSFDLLWIISAYCQP